MKISKEPWNRFLLTQAFGVTFVRQKKTQMTQSLALSALLATVWRQARDPTPKPQSRPTPRGRNELNRGLW